MGREDGMGGIKRGSGGSQFAVGNQDQIKVENTWRGNRNSRFSLCNRRGAQCIVVGGGGGGQGNKKRKT